MIPSEPVPTWRKVVGVGFGLTILGLLLFAVFYPALTGASAHDTFYQVMFIVIVLGVIFFSVFAVLGVREIYRRYYKR